MKRLGRAVGARGTIELHIREVAQLFDSFDPCPFNERDLDADAEEYMVASIRELRAPASVMVFHIDRPADGENEARMLETAIHRHFMRKVEISSRELQALLRRGWISLLIGLTFLVGLLGVSELITTRISVGPFAAVLHESLLIGGWVAMWRPLEIFLYDWWPIVGQRRTYAALAQLPISILTAASPARL